LTKKYAEKAIEILRKAGIDARGVNLFGLNGIALKQGFFGQTCYSLSRVQPKTHTPPIPSGFTACSAVSRFR
jgi:hypothetical protein